MQIRFVLDPVLYTLGLIESQFDSPIHIRALNNCSDAGNASEVMEAARRYMQDFHDLGAELEDGMSFLDLLYIYLEVFAGNIGWLEIACSTESSMLEAQLVQPTGESLKLADNMITDACKALRIAMNNGTTSAVAEDVSDATSDSTASIVAEDVSKAMVGDVDTAVADEASTPVSDGEGKSMSSATDGIRGGADISSLLHDVWFKFARQHYQEDWPHMVGFGQKLQQRLDLPHLLQNMSEMTGLEPAVSSFKNMYIVVTAYLLPHTFLIGVNQNTDLAMGLDYRRGEFVINSIIHELSHFYISMLLSDPAVDDWLPLIAQYKDFSLKHAKEQNTYPEVRDWLEEELVKAFADFYVGMCFGMDFTGFIGQTRLANEFEPFLFQNYRREGRLVGGLTGTFYKYLEEFVGGSSAR